jgi:hypothetical protein
MPAFLKRFSKLRFEFVSRPASRHAGGLPALEALARQFGLWDKLRALPGLEPRPAHAELAVLPRSGSP